MQIPQIFMLSGSNANYCTTMLLNECDFFFFFNTNIYKWITFDNKNVLYNLER